MRRKLIDEIGGEIREFMLEFELHARGQKRRAFEQAGDHRIEPIGHQAAQALGDAGIFLREFAGLFAQERKFAIVEFEEFTVHRVTPDRF